MTPARQRNPHTHTYRQEAIRAPTHHQYKEFSNTIQKGRGTDWLAASPPSPVNLFQNRLFEWKSMGGEIGGSGGRKKSCWLAPSLLVGWTWGALCPEKGPGTHPPPTPTHTRAHEQSKGLFPTSLGRRRRCRVAGGRPGTGQPRPTPWGSGWGHTRGSEKTFCK